MSEFSDLRQDQSTFLLALVAKSTGDRVDWRYANDPIKMDRGQLTNIQTGQMVVDVPLNNGFYHDLERKGYCFLTRTQRGGFSLRLAERAFEYAKYAALPPIKRWFVDRRYELREETTLRAKVIGALAAAVLLLVVSIVSVILLRLLGWVKNGS